MHYAYILRSISHPDQRYLGSTSDLRARLAKHNSGQVPHTSKFVPWVVDAAIAVRGKSVAVHLEQYFKSGAGRAFANRHFPHNVLVHVYQLWYYIRKETR